MKKNKIILVCLLFCYGYAGAQSIDPVSLIIAKVIKAIDLKVQQLQNQTIWLQHAQQVVENELSKTKLAEISDWQQKQEALYAGYFEELKTVKSGVQGLSQVKKVIDLQNQVMTEYSRFGKDALAKPNYDALLNTSLDISRTLQMVLTKGVSMKDGDRLCMIATLRDAMNQCLQNIKALNTQALKSAAYNERMKADLQYVKRLNGIQ